MSVQKSDLTPDRIKRFWAKVIKHQDECWEWTGAKVRNGYGYFAINSERGPSHCSAAHRVSWVITNGDIPDGLLVLHKCDNPPCTRPDHLFLGTFKDNNQDTIRKGRQSRGHYKLTPKALREIRILNKMDFSHQTIANVFGVHRSTIKKIISGKQWVGVGE
jgi:hypothetical protein